MKADRRLVIDDGDTSSAILALLSTMPRAGQAELLATLQVRPSRVRWLDPPVAARLIEAIEGWDPASRALIENRLVPPWMRRARRQAERDNAIRDAAPLYAEHLTGRAIAAAIAAHCQRLPPARDPRREAVERILAVNRNQPPGVTTLRNALADVTREAGQK